LQVTSDALQAAGVLKKPIQAPAFFSERVLEFYQ
jgi:hypothetical protein